MSLYKLANPQPPMKSALIDTHYVSGFEWAIITIEWHGMCARDLGYSFKGLMAAKRYFGREYQSKKKGQQSPVWGKQELPTN